MAKIGTPLRRETFFHQNAFWPQDGPNSLPEVAKRPEMASRRPRNGGKISPNGLQGRPQGGPKRAPRLDETLIFESCLCVVHPSLFSCVFKKTRLASTRRSFWASPWAIILFWGAPDGTSCSSWVPRRAQDAPGLPPRRVQSQKRRLASTRRSFCFKLSVSSRRGSFFLFPGPPPRRAQAQERRLASTRCSVLTMKKPALLTVLCKFPAHCLKRKPLVVR